MTMRTAVTGRFLSIVSILGAAAFFAQPALAQMANGKPKFVGNVTGNSVPANFNTYWNQITPENATKWGSVESTRNQMNWGAADAAYNHAQANGYKFKFHTFVWGSQFPGWLTGLTQQQQRAEIEEWIRLACQRDRAGASDKYRNCHDQFLDGHFHVAGRPYRDGILEHRAHCQRTNSHGTQRGA